MKSDELREEQLEVLMNLNRGRLCVSEANTKILEIYTRSEPKEQNVCPECGGSERKYLCECDLKETRGCDHCKDEETIPCPSCTGKTPVDNIREAFEKVQGISSFVIWSGKDNKYILTPDAMGSHAHWMILANDLFNTFKNWYPELYKSQQTEIERLKDLIEEMKNEDIRKVGLVSELKAENEAMRCCGNCGKRHYFGIDKDCDEIRFRDRSGSSICDNWVKTPYLDNWQPKENN